MQPQPQNIPGRFDPQPAPAGLEVPIFLRATSESAVLPELLEPAKMPLLELALQLAPQVRLPTSILESSFRLLTSGLAQVQAASSLATDIHNWPALRLQKFLSECDLALAKGQATKPVFFSAQARSIAVSAHDYAEKLQTIWEYSAANPSRFYPLLLPYIQNRLEFTIHEYGHVLSANGHISAAPQARHELTQRRSALALQLLEHGSAEDVTFLKEVESDLRAEVLRCYYPRLQDLRAPQRFAELGVHERVLPGGTLTPNEISTASLMRILAWQPLCLSLGPTSLAPRVYAQAQQRCAHEAPQLLALCQPLAEYLCAYFQAQRVDFALAAH
jgi:hypothetical protein